jgi:hypothetical protein
MMMMTVLAMDSDDHDENVSDDSYNYSNDGYCPWLSLV